jgi:hypothetical protein
MEMSQLKRLHHRPQPLGYQVARWPCVPKRRSTKRAPDSRLRAKCALDSRFVLAKRAPWQRGLKSEQQGTKQMASKSRKLSGGRASRAALRARPLLVRAPLVRTASAGWHHRPHRVHRHRKAAEVCLTALARSLAAGSGRLPTAGRRPVPARQTVPPGA